MRHRTVLLALVVPAMFIAAETRLSRSDSLRTSEPEARALWGEAEGPERFTFKNCPMTLSTDAGSPYALTTVENGVRFDLDGDGQLERVAWVEAATDIAFLALDQDGDGRITSGRELIGRHTLPGASNGPNALLQLAAPQKVAVLDDSTPAFERILLWRDVNHNGSSEAIELRRARDELSAIGLGFGFHRRSDRHGNYSRFRGFVHVRTEPGLHADTTVEDERARRRYMYDVCLVSE